MRPILVLAVVALAVIGALLHPLALVLGVLPFHTAHLVAALNETKSLIADVLGWAVVALLLVMLSLVVAGRIAPRSAKPARRPLGSLNSGRIAVGIIAYNEVDAIGALVHSFKRQDGVAEVIVVDNNSSDGTAEAATAAGARVVHEARQGYGYACIRALQESALSADADVAVLVEGDGSFVADDIPKFRAYIGQADMVVGTRVISSLVDDDSQMDYFFTWGNMAVSTLLRLRFWHPQYLGAASLTDVGCTYRAIRKESLQHILPDLEIGGNHFSPHMLLVALYRNLSLIEIPVTLRKRIGESKGAGRSFWSGLRVGLVMIWHIITYAPNSTSATKAESARVAGVAEP